MQGAGNRGPSTQTALTSQASNLPRQIGPYRLLELIGQGGMGEVYLAEQEKPVRRRVALKLIKLGMDTRNVIARFEAERQALAMMNHPNIAAVHDAGASEQGRPYFVMEYVPGEPITAYCDKHKLSIKERLDLFIQVCSAIQHAHTKAVIHRDIKPSNILVMLQDGKPVPKVIDFGLAKATNQRLTEHTLFTEHGVLIGTPEYMSPEQAEMTQLDIDTRTDIYSLGVLLYELLTGTRPFDAHALRRAGLEAMQRIIREVDPPKPSTRLSQIRAATNSEPGAQATGASPGNRGSRNKGIDPSPGHPSPLPDSLTADIRAAMLDAGPAPGSAAAPQMLPSASLAEVCTQRATEPRILIRTLRGDLDWIVMKCLEKDRTRRYDSANAIELDLNRHLRNEPVAAGPPGFLYRVRKLVRRRKPQILTLFLIIGIVLFGTYQYRSKARVARMERARSAYNAGLAYAQKGNLDDAMNEYRRAVSLDETLFPAWFNMALVSRQKGDKVEAIQFLRQAHILEPNNIRPLAALVALSKEAGDNQKENEYCRELLSLATDSRKAREIGWSFRRLQRWSEAMEAFRRATEIDPRDAKACHDLAWTYLLAPENSGRDSRQGLSLALRAKDLNEAEPGLPNTLALAYLRNGLLEEAYPLAKGNPKTPVEFLVLALIQVSDKHFEEAKQSYAMAMHAAKGEKLDNDLDGPLLRDEVAGLLERHGVSIEGN
jgi:serine/threonine protein kinase/Flp pilus assembly protein TadD